MIGHHDDRLAVGLAHVLEERPRDVLEILAALAERHPGALEGREGAIHAFLHQRLRKGRIVPAGRGPSGRVRYALPGGAAEAGATTSPSAEPGPIAPGVSRRALQVAGAVRDPADRGRVFADVAAHLAALEAAGAPERFGRTGAARTLLHRADRGRATIFAAGGVRDGLLRLGLHEGPWILAAVLAFLLLRAFVVEVYQIPSPSMEPTLERGDRVVVTKIGGPGIPERWGVYVFVEDDVNYVKRVVGLPGEQIALLRGDVYVDGELLVKPDDVREALRLENRVWAFEGGAHPSWEARSAHDETTWTREDEPLHAAYRFGRDDSQLVTDGYLVLDAVRPEGGAVLLTLFRGDPSREVDDEAGTGVAWTLEASEHGVRLAERRTDGRDVLAEAALDVPAGPVRLRLAYVDGRLRAGVAGWAWEGARAAPYGPLDARIGVRGAGGGPVRLRLDQDIHYANRLHHAVPTTPGEPNPHAIPAGHVFVLGDNTLNSEDSRSRQRGDIPVGAFVGPVRLRIWPPSRFGTPR